MHFRAAQKLLRAALPYCATLAWQAAASLDPFDMRVSGWQGSDRVRREAAQARQPSKRLAGCSAHVTTATRTVRRWRPFSRRCCAPTTRRWSEMKIVLGKLSAGHTIAPSRTGGSQPTFSRAWGVSLTAVARGSTIVLTAVRQLYEYSSTRTYSST